MKSNKFIHKDRGSGGRDSQEMSFSDDMLAILDVRYTNKHIQSPEQRKRICDIFGFMIKIANKYLPPKQRKIFYSVWIRSGGKIKEGIMEYSRKTGAKYVTNYGNYYKAVKNLKTVMAKIGYDRFIREYIREGSMFEDDSRNYK